MRNLTSIIAIAMLLPILSPAQKKYKVVVLGSSSAYGIGASVPDSSWVGRTKAYYKSLHQLDTVINLAVPGSFSDSGVKLLSQALSYDPDLVLVSFPSNDIVADLGIPHYMRNLRKMYNTVTAAGKKCYISTTQPRDDQYNEYTLKVARDSIVKEFPSNYMQFYDPLVAPGSYAINPLYSVEGTHPNDAGHRLLFQAVLAAQVIPSTPLPLVLTDFSGNRTDQGVMLSWSASNTDSDLNFFIERSTDGTTYGSIYQVKATSDGVLRRYSFTDQNPPASRTSYRIRAVMDGNNITYSNVLNFDVPVTSLTIEKVYISGLDITTAIGIPKDETFRLAIFNTGGIPIQRQSYTGRAPVVTLHIPMIALPAGIYYLEIATSDGQRAIKAFTVL